MSKDWEIINRESAAKLLCDIVETYLDKMDELEDKMQDLENECMDKLFIFDNGIYNRRQLAELHEYWRLTTYLGAAPRLTVSEEMRKAASKLLERATEHLKTEVSRKAAEDIFDKIIEVV